MYIELTTWMKEEILKYGGYEFRENMLLASDVEHVIDDLLYEIKKRDKEIKRLESEE